MFNISSPRPDRFYKAKSRDHPATGETGNPETHVAKKGPAGRPVNPNSARQKKLAAAAANK